MEKSSGYFPMQTVKSKFVPPEGGWGYAVMTAVSLIFTVTILPVSLFGQVFGPFVATLGDEIGITTLTLGTFNTTLFLTGLPANHLLQKYTYRKVALLGAISYFIGSFLVIYAQSVYQILLTFGVLQGFGFGLLLPSGFTAIHEYFEKRENLAISVCQTIIGGMGMVWPVFMSYLMTTYGFRGTVAILSALTLHLVVAAVIFQPAKLHYKRVPIAAVELEMYSKIPEGPIIAEKQFNSDAVERNLLSKDGITEGGEDEVKDLGKWQSIVKSLDLVLFKDLSYISLAIGTSMAMTSDILFISVIPVILTSYGYQDSDRTLMLTVFFVADLIGRLSLSVVNGIFAVWNRYVVLSGAIFSTIFRIAFSLNLPFWWMIIVMAVLGFLRCGIQVPYSLVFSEKYGPRFVTAFSLNMVVCGIVVFSISILSGWVKDLTGSDNMVVHLFTVVYALCAVPWSIEILIEKLMKKKS